MQEAPDFPGRSLLTRPNRCLSPEQDAWNIAPNNQEGKEDRKEKPDGGYRKKTVERLPFSGEIAGLQNLSEWTAYES
jgi:hypothetical protein